jgi:D-alanyl-D-alanine carboxypeptidase/Putative peptidoglycan binding domain
MSKVAWDYIVDIKMPADLKGVTPGKLPESLLRPVPGGGKLHHRAADAWNAMVAKAKADGLELKPTSSGDLYRSYESQLAGFKSRYVLEPVVGTSTKSFEGKTWYLKKGMAMMATPGKSNHNLGIAVDVSSAGEAKRLNWLIANVKDFGFSWEVVPSEPWHLRLVTGDNPTPAVIAFTGGASAPVVASAPPANLGVDPNKALQQALKNKGFYLGEIDGNIATPQTQEAIKAFKVKNGLAADSVVGPKVKELLGLK